ncbi:hypothetical protein FG386_003171 [Cryptosporidium ryanae]|uniref:uncharacterized protein n=1 Tax=Cryptosporidium ryanae TaxID=515981 RepID=UPI00351A21DA|nr:hypothetical protein FG386_003171 [Cryptosporidium ryanae]
MTPKLQENVFNINTRNMDMTSNKVQKLKNEKEKIKEWNENLANMVTNIDINNKKLNKLQYNTMFNNKQQVTSPFYKITNGQNNVGNKINNDFKGLNTNITKNTGQGSLEDQYTIALIERQNIEESCKELKRRYNQLVLRYEEAIEQKESFREGLKNKIIEYQKLQELHNGTQSLLAVGNKAQEELYQTQKQFQIILGKRNVEFSNLKDELEEKKKEYEELEKKFEIISKENKNKSECIDEITKNKTNVEEKFVLLVKNNNELIKERDRMKRELKIYEPLAHSKEMVDKMAVYLETLLIKRNEVIAEITKDLSKITSDITIEISNVRTDIVGIENNIQKFSGTISHFKNDIITSENQRIQKSDDLVNNLKNSLMKAKNDILNYKKLLFNSVGSFGDALEPSLTFEVKKGSILYKYQGNHTNTVKCYCRVFGTNIEYTTSNNVVKNIPIEKIIGVEYGSNSNSFRRLEQPKNFFHEIFRKSKNEESNEKIATINTPWLFFSVRVQDKYDSACIDFIATSLQSAMSWVVTIGRYATYVQRSKGVLAYNFIQTKHEFYCVSLRMKMMYLCKQKEMNVFQIYITAIHTCCLKNPQLIRNQSAWENLKNIMRRITNQKYSNQVSLIMIISDITEDNIDEKGFVSDRFRDKFFHNVKNRSENRVCFDCESRNPTWLSLSFAIFICLNCSSDHRKMGVHISFVRSADLDKFTLLQLARIEIGGNSRARSFFKRFFGTEFCSKTREYANSVYGTRYKQLLDTETMNIEKSILNKDDAKLLSGVPCDIAHNIEKDDSFLETKISKTQDQKINPVRISINRFATVKSDKTSSVNKGRRLDENFDFDSLVS